MEYIGWFLFSFILIYIIYYFLFIKKARRGDKISAEAQYLVALYKLDVNKFSYYRFVRVVGLVTSFDIAIVATIVAKVDGIIWQILFGFVAVIPVILLTFMLVGKFYQNKQTKDNTKELEKEKKYLDKKDEKKQKKKKKKESKKINKKKGKKKNG